MFHQGNLLSFQGNFKIRIFQAIKAFRTVIPPKRAVGCPWLRAGSFQWRRLIAAGRQVGWKNDFQRGAYEREGGGGIKRRRRLNKAFTVLMLPFKAHLRGKLGADSAREEDSARLEASERLQPNKQPMKKFPRCATCKSTNCVNPCKEKPGSNQATIDSHFLWVPRGKYGYLLLGKRKALTHRLLRFPRFNHGCRISTQRLLELSLCAHAYLIFRV